MIRRCVFLCLWLSAIGPCLWAAPSPQLVVEAPAELAAVAEEVRAIGGGDFSAGLYITGVVGFATPIRVVLATENSRLAREVPEWVSGFARGSEAVIVLFPARVHSYPDRNLRTLVHHEVAHVLVAQAARGRPVPRWFNEGVATVAAREWGIEDRARFAMAVLGGRPRRARDLDASFRGGGSQVVRAYALSAAFVRFLQRRYGVSAPAVVLEGVAGDLDFDEAFRRATGDSLANAEQIFFEKDAFWNTWLPFLTSTGALWMAITTLALIAIRRRRARSRQMLDAWEDEEEAERRLPGPVHPGYGNDSVD
ncbi:MAG: peptidase MA family metallohydrolase [Thermoanaerobaculales bacterium]